MATFPQFIVSPHPTPSTNCTLQTLQFFPVARFLKFTEFWSNLQNYKIQWFFRANLYQRRKDLHKKYRTIYDINESMTKVKKARKYSCLRVLSTNQHLTAHKSCQRKPLPPNSLKKHSCECKYFLTGNSNLFAQTLFTQFFFPAAWMAGLFSRALWPKYKRFIWGHANWMFFKMWIAYLSTLPISPSIYFKPPPLHHPILAYLRCFHLLQIIITLLLLTADMGSQP